MSHMTHTTPRRNYVSLWAKRLVAYVILTLVGLIILFPFLYMMIASVKTPKDAQANPRRLLPYTQRIVNYEGVDLDLFVFNIQDEEVGLANVSKAQVELTGEAEGQTSLKTFAENEIRFGFFVTREAYERLLTTVNHADARNAQAPFVLIPTEHRITPVSLGDGFQLAANPRFVSLFAEGSIELVRIDERVNFPVNVTNPTTGRTVSTNTRFQSYVIFLDDEQLYTTLADGRQLPLRAYITSIPTLGTPERLTVNYKEEIELETLNPIRNTATFRFDEYDLYTFTAENQSQDLLAIRTPTQEIYINPDDPEFALYASGVRGDRSEFVEFQFDNYNRVLEQRGLDRSLINTFLVTICVVIGQVTTSLFGGYAFSRIQFKGRDTIFVMYLGSIMIPFVVLIVPMYRLMVEMGWQNHLVALIVPWIFTAYGTFLMRQFFITIPKEIEEAALLDGCSRFRILWTIFIPLSTPAIATQAIFTFLYAWNSFLWPLLIISTGNAENKVLTLSLIDLSNAVSSQEPNLVFTGAAITILPPVIVFILAQKYFVEGIATSGLKG